MPLTKEQETLYRQTMEEAKRQTEELDREMQKEIELTRKKLAELQESKKSYIQVYEGACRLLGLPVEKKENPEKDPLS
ncbi:MAG: hypothetical protein MUP70_02480 [Candidatus Aminicenantes bacterium]|nr:hypothetical protein [Candidatus Aminicenantes bacterium]